MVALDRNRRPTLDKPSSDRVQGLFAATIALSYLVLQPLAASAAEVSIGDGGSLRVTDGARSLQLGGRARLSTAFYDEDVTHLPKGLELDVALATMHADLDHDWHLSYGYDFAKHDVYDAYISRTGLPIGAILVGQFRPQIGLFDGGAWIIFNQRSMIEQALALPRTLGAGLEGGIGRVSYSLAVNGDAVGHDTRGTDPLKYSTRIVVRPAPDNWGVFHVGFNAIYQQTGEAGINKFAASPVALLEDTPTLLSISQSHTDYRQVLGGEALWMRGALTLQSEYMHAMVDSVGEPSIHGCYLQGTYIIGAERHYSNDSATQGRPILQNPAAGAWEFSLRYDTIDMRAAAGGAADNYGVAIVRYFSNPLRLGTTITHSNIKHGLNGSEKITSLQLRLQWFL